LASFENKALGKSLDLSSRVLTTMLQNANTEDSRVLAVEVHKSLIDGLSNNYSEVKDLKVATALFDVLIGVKAPSILVETSFITHPREEARLRDSSYQWKVARGIAAGVKKFIKGHQQTPQSSL
ncbi:MAG: N-acetylmuramoyl-L-alanine amidase, partial [Deltaproteobacteria bacterium]|nr:N-acetylmuramoyl-L-alanine amidase [Deltaproteobacteria bacterium]